MAEGSPSPTARRVAAHRLGFERVDAPYGDPQADDALARDVADAEPAGRNEAMGRYLKGRTAFFDRVVTRAVDRHISQVVSVGAGFDGRAWRYGAPGVRWWEVDRPDTQADKRARLGRLHIDAGQVSFVGHDLRGPGLAAALLAAGYDDQVPSLMICEGVAVYLDLPVFESLLAELRTLATAGTRLALSLSSPNSSAEHAANRQRFEAAVADLGEPAANALSPSDAAGLLARTGWRSVELSEKATSAGFAVTVPVWVPAPNGEAPDPGPRPASPPTTHPRATSPDSGPTGAATIRAFLPARDFEASKAFYRALGFETVLDADVAIFRAGGSQFILTRFFQAEYAENSMMQIVVDDLDAWWIRLAALDLPKRFGVRAPTAPALQAWGLRVAFVVDPSGVLWHFVEG